MKFYRHLGWALAASMLVLNACSTGSKSVPVMKAKESGPKAQVFEGFAPYVPAPAAVADATAHPRNIILMIGDGMGLTQMYAGMTANRGRLHLERCTHVGLQKTYSSDAYITDSAAGATAFACGQKTYNGAIAVDTDQKPLPTILEMAEQKGLLTGLIATCGITHATPAAFIAHQPHRDMYEAIAADFLRTPVDLLVGGGRKHFSRRKDGRDLIAELRQKGYAYAEDMATAQALPLPLVVLTADEHNPRVSQGRGDLLRQATAKALSAFAGHDQGFFLMIEGSMIDWGGHANELDYVIEEVLDFDQAIGQVLDFAAKDGQTLVIITADHETGGLTLNGGNLQSGRVEGKFTSGEHTAVIVPVYAFGPGAEAFTGIYQNTDLFHKMLKSYGWK